MPGGPLEKDTCRDYVLPRLKAAGWADDQIVEQYRITDGRVITVGKKHRRATPLRADYVLEYLPGVPIAVVEAKRQYAVPGKGMQQAKAYAHLLDLPFAYSTNGKGLVEDDRDTGHEAANLPGFPHRASCGPATRRGRGSSSPRSLKACSFRSTATCATPTARSRSPATTNARRSTGRSRRYCEATSGCCSRSPPGPARRSCRCRSCGSCGRAPGVPAATPASSTSPTATSSSTSPSSANTNRRSALRGLTDLEAPGRRGQGRARDLLRSLPAAVRHRRRPQRHVPRVRSGLLRPGHRRRVPPRQRARRVVVAGCPRVLLAGHAARHDRNAEARRDDRQLRVLRRSAVRVHACPGHRRRLPRALPRPAGRAQPDAHGWAPEQGQLDLFGKEIPDNLYTTKDFERVVSLLSRTDAAAKHLTEYLQRTDPFAKTIVFCVNQEHAGEMRRALHNANAKFAKQHPNYVVRIVSDEHEIGRGHLSDFADTEKDVPVIATTSEMLSTGVDLPTVRNIVLFRTVGSMAAFKQMIGRGTRLFPDEDKLSFDIIDYSGATALFSDPEFDGPPERVDREEIDEDGNVVEEVAVEEPEPEFGSEGDGDDADDDVHPEDLEEEPRPSSTSMASRCGSLPRRYTTSTRRRDGSGSSSTATS